MKTITSLGAFAVLIFIVAPANAQVAAMVRKGRRREPRRSEYEKSQSRHSRHIERLLADRD